jgi:exosortase C (VPDSG-CTERM-specific)
VCWIVLFTLGFFQPLSRLFQQSLASELNSYIPLVPLVSAYLIFAPRKRLVASYRSSIVAAIVMSALAAAAIGASVRMQGALSENDSLGLIVLAYVCILAAGGFLFLGSSWMALAAFPLAFLLFVIPLPDAAVYWIETTSVSASADVSYWLFRITGTPILRDGAVFALPGIVLQVAQECSGIHSTVVLFLTSLVAGHLFIQSPWRRLIFAAVVVPLAIVRNSVRILVIGLLCVYVGPDMIDSWIHHHGGPVFFVLSLAPLFVLLLWLRREDRR